MLFLSELIQKTSGAESRKQRAELSLPHASYLLMVLNRAAFHERARKTLCVLSFALSTATGLSVIV
jgi:L-fucose mutarotase/ribose pyranase (RbsD/FucU family)